MHVLLCMYANPKIANETLKKLRALSQYQSTLARGSDEWNEVNHILNNLLSEWASARMLPDPLALTYK